MIMMRILGPLITFVNRPWKVSISVRVLVKPDRDPVDVSRRRVVRVWYVPEHLGVFLGLLKCWM